MVANVQLHAKLMAAAKSSFLFVREDAFEGEEDHASLQTLEDHAVGLMNSAG